MFEVDRATVEALNRIAQRQPLRLAALLAATYLLVIPIVILLGLVVAALRRRDTHPGRGGRGELHPPAPTDPGVSLSAHRALVALVTRPRGSTASGQTCLGHGW
jgi:hypothetical protein